jgi:hypothetical protein
MADKKFIDSDGIEQLMIDGDTVTNATGKRYRIDGLDALEIDKIVDENGKPVFKRGEFGGDKQAEAIAKIIKEGNFNKMNYSGEIDKSKGEREIIGLSNPQGEDLTETLYRSGLLKVNEYTSDKALRAKQEGELLRALFGEGSVPYSDIAREANDYIDTAGKTFKTLAVNEKTYNPEVHSGVQFRHPDRTLDNKADGVLSSMGIAYDLGWEGVKEGLWGYADALGQVTGVEMLERLGESGVARARQRIMDKPEITLDYRDINSIKKGFEYTLNNTAMMIPQLMTLFGSMALAVPAKAIGGVALGTSVALGPISLISAGQTWNEMEGEKGIKQFIGASFAGVGVAVLERFGLNRLIAPAEVLSEQGAKKVIEAIATKKNIPYTQAATMFNQTAKQEIGKFSKELAIRFDAKDFRDFSFKELGKRTAMGFGVESGTEMSQDALMMATSAALSDTEYSGEDVIHRLINAGLAGGVVGAKLSGAGSLLQQGKNKLLQSEREQNSADRFNLIEQKKTRDLQRQQASLDPTKGIEDVDEILKQVDDGYVMFNADDPQKKNLLKGLHNAYKETQKGIKNYVTNNQDLFEYMSSAFTGLKKLVLAQEKNVGNMEKLVESPELLKIFHLVAAETTGRYHDGPNHKEFHDLVSGEIASQVDERGIANLFGERKLTNKNIGNISSQIRAFATPEGNNPSKFQLFEAYKLTQAGAFPLAKTYFSNKSTIQQKESARIALRALGLQRPAQILEYYNLAKKFDKEDGLIDLNLTVEEEEAQKILYISAKQIKNAYDTAFDNVSKQYFKETGKVFKYDSDYWWQHQGFDWKKVKKNRKEFMSFLERTTTLNIDEREALYESIVRDGQGTINTENSLIDGKVYLPYSVNEAVKGMTKDPEFKKKFASDNMFEALRRDRLEAAKYASTTKYFGHGGRKLNYMFDRFIKEQEARPDGPTKFTRAEIEQAAFYIKSMIDSTHGNYNRIESKKVAAVNSFLTGWSLLAGLPLAMLSSLPETLLIYFNVKNDVEFKAATKQLIAQVGQAFDDAMKAEVEKTEKLLKKINQSTDTNSVVDRLATGERDVAFMRMHEAFFSGIGLTKITQVQRRMNAGFALDFIRSGFSMLSLAPRKEKEIVLNTAIGRIKKTQDVGFDFDKFQDIEMRTYNQLTDLGFDVEYTMNLMQDLNEISRDELFNISDNKSLTPTDPLNIRDPSPRSEALRRAVKTSFNRGQYEVDPSRKGRKLSNADILQEAARLQGIIDDKMDLAVYRFVKERIQLPSAANRPLAFQDPHYQLLFQFNGFLSTFTGNLVPKIWNAQLRKGTVKVKYDTFALIITMMALGGASQYLKDLIKFGRSSPYLDEVSLVQRAVFSSGVLGQYERIIDFLHPLYPDRNTGSDYLFNTVLGEAGPSARNIQKVLSSTGLMLEGETERGVNKLLSATPFVGPFTGTRRAMTQGIHGNNPLPDISLPTKNDIIDSLLN